MHSDITLDIMDDVTASLWSAFCHFSHEVCPAFNTKELCREANAHYHRQTQNPNQRKKAKPFDGELLKKTLICLQCLYGHKPTQTPQTM
jgi:hypothetical protein